MLSWGMMMVGLFYFCIKTGVTQGKTKVLFPGATRVKRGMTDLIPTFHNSINDAHLLFEILLSGMHFDSNGAFSIEDAELSSLHKTRSLDFIYKEIIPKNLTDVSRLIFNLSNHIGPLHQGDFEHILLTLVYTTQKMASAAADNQREMWGKLFIGLYTAIKKDLTDTNKLSQV